MTAPAAREVSAGGVLIRGSAAGPEVCLVQRRRHGSATWSLPKGHLEPAEDPPTAARREVAEETGWHGDIVCPLGVLAYEFTVPETGRRVRKQVTFYLMRAGAATDGGPDRREVDAVQWCSFAQAIRAVAHEDERGLLRAAQRLAAESS